MIKRFHFRHGLAEKPRRCCARAGLRAICLALLVVVGLAHAATPLEDWRGEAGRVRMLAENDAPRAYAEALQLQAAFPADAMPADRVRILNLLTRIEIYLARTEEAAMHARLAQELATQHADRIGEAEAALNISMNSINEGKIDALIAASTRGLAVLEGVDRPELLSEALLRMAMMYLREGKLEEAVTMAMQTMEIARNSKTPLALTYAHQGLAISFNLSDRFKEAHAHYLQMREAARMAGSKLLEAYALNGMGYTIVKLGDPEAGETAIRDAISIFRAVGAPFGVSHSLFGLADHFRSQGRHADALPLFSEVVLTYERYPNDIGLWFALNARSSVYLSLGNLPAALSDAERAYGLAQKVGLPLYRIESAQRTAAIFAAKGEHRRAYEFSLEAANLADKATRQKANTRMVELAQRYETESKQREIDELTRRNQQQTAELRQRELQQRWLWTVLGGSVAMLTGTAFFLLRLRRSHGIIRTLNTSLEQRVHNRTAALRQQTRYLRTLIDTLPWWVWLKDTESRYLAVNQAAADTCGMSADELVGKSDVDVRPRELADAFRADDLEVMLSRSRKTVEEPQVISSGTTWMETFKAPVIDEDGTVLGTVGFARDISERKAAEAAREVALAEAQRLAQVRSDFLAQMSHELRTPLNGILGYTQILRRDKSLGEQQLAGMNVIQQSGEHLLTLINDILDSAKIEAGKLELYPGDISLTRFLRAIAEMIQVKAEQKGVEFLCDTDSSLPVAIHADEKRLRQILLNLLSNAVKFTDRGVVTLRVRFTPPGRLRFEVQDTGIGVAADQMDAIFQPFTQTGEAQRRVSGTGLGLAISGQFVRLMGGDIQVESRVGLGSTFWFELDLPVVAAEIAVTPPERNVTGYEGPRKTILVVDDLAENRAVAVGLLGQIGFAMAEANNGHDALEKARTLRPDLILMDVIMPGMDGLEATRSLRRLPFLEHVPIIAVSASVSGNDVERYLAAGVNAFQAKPLDRGSLLHQIAALAQLTWTYELSVPASSSAKASAPLEVPPPQEMERLYYLARIGNMHDILRQANYLAELDERYRPFTDRLSMLAKRFQSKAILRFVEEHMPKEADA